MVAGAIGARVSLRVRLTQEASGVRSEGRIRPSRGLCASSMRGDFCVFPSQASLDAAFVGRVARLRVTCALRTRRRRHALAVAVFSQDYLAWIEVVSSVAIVRSGAAARRRFFLGARCVYVIRRSPVGANALASAVRCDRMRKLVGRSASRGIVAGTVGHVPGRACI